MDTTGFLHDRMEGCCPQDGTARGQDLQVKEEECQVLWSPLLLTSSSEAAALPHSRLEPAETRAKGKQRHQVSQAPDCQGNLCKEQG